METQPTLERAPHTYWIRERHKHALEIKIARLERRARKLGTRFEWRWTGQTRPVVIRNPDTLVECVRTDFQLFVDAEIPRYAGWTFLATLQHIEGANVIRKILELDLPAEYRTCKPECHHCKLDRVRRDTYVVSNGTEFKQVGRQCLRDFLGHENPVALADWTEAMANFYADCVGFSGDDDMLDDGGGRGGGCGGLTQRTEYRLLTILSGAARVIHQHGFVSGKAAREHEGLHSTRERLEWMLWPGNDKDCQRAAREFWESIGDEEKQLAEQSIAWAQEIDPETTSDYLHNLRAVAAVEFIEPRLFGIAVSMISAYQRDLGLAAERKAKVAVSNYVGEVGKRLRGHKVTFERAILLGTGQFGETWLYKFVDTAGNQLVWKTGTVQDLEGGEVLSLTGSVAQHGEYKGFKQTSLKRCKYEVLSREAVAPATPESCEG